MSFVTNGSVLLSGGVVVLASSILSSLLQKDPQEPLFHFSEAARRIAAGDLQVTLSEDHPAEWGQLACAINRMTRTIAEASSRHDVAVNALELQLAARTAELQQTQEQAAIADRLLESTRAELEIARYETCASQAVAEARTRAQSALMEAILGILIGTDAHGNITHWNTVAESTFAISAKEVLGKPLSQSGIAWDINLIQGNFQQCQERNRTLYLNNVRFQRPDEKEGFLSITFAPIQSDVGNDLAFLLLVVDITEKRLLENQLAHAQKMESIGQLAAGIAHEINTPIQYVSDNVRFLQDAFATLQSVQTEFQNILSHCQTDTLTPELVAGAEEAIAAADMEYLLDEIPIAIQQSLEGADRVAHIVRAMKEFSHPGTSEKVGLDINRAIQSTLTVARNEWKYVAVVVTDLAANLPVTMCQPGDFNQVILNLVVNAAHAIAEAGSDMDHKGTITVSTRHCADCVEVRISDTGTGIPEAIRSRIFDPFFTTKEVGKGTGQGLAIAHSIIVEKHGGTIRFETEIGQGTTFIIQLPLETERTECDLAA